MQKGIAGRVESCSEEPEKQSSAVGSLPIAIGKLGSVIFVNYGLSALMPQHVSTAFLTVNLWQVSKKPTLVLTAKLSQMLRCMIRKRLRKWLPS